MKQAMSCFIEFSTVRGTILDVRIFTCEKEISAMVLQLHPLDCLNESHPCVTKAVLVHFFA